MIFYHYCFAYRFNQDNVIDSVILCPSSSPLNAENSQKFLVEKDQTNLATTSFYSDSHVTPKISSSLSTNSIYLINSSSVNSHLLEIKNSANNTYSELLRYRSQEFYQKLANKQNNLEKTENATLNRTINSSNENDKALDQLNKVGQEYLLLSKSIKANPTYKSINQLEKEENLKNLNYLILRSPLNSGNNCKRNEVDVNNGSYYLNLGEYEQDSVHGEQLSTCLHRSISSLSLSYHQKSPLPYQNIGASFLCASNQPANYYQTPERKSLGGNLYSPTTNLATATEATNSQFDSSHLYKNGTVMSCISNSSSSSSTTITTTASTGSIISGIQQTLKLAQKNSGNGTNRVLCANGTVMQRAPLTRSTSSGFESLLVTNKSNLQPVAIQLYPNQTQQQIYGHRQHYSPNIAHPYHHHHHQPVQINSMMMSQMNSRSSTSLLAMNNSNTNGNEYNLNAHKTILPYGQSAIVTGGNGGVSESCVYPSTLYQQSSAPAKTNGNRTTSGSASLMSIYQNKCNGLTVITPNCSGSGTTTTAAIGNISSASSSSSSACSYSQRRLTQRFPIVTSSTSATANSRERLNNLLVKGADSTCAFNDDQCRTGSGTSAGNENQTVTTTTATATTHGPLINSLSRSFFNSTNIFDTKKNKLFGSVSSIDLQVSYCCGVCAMNGLN